MTRLLNTGACYSIVKARLDEIGRAVADACEVTLTSSWLKAAAIVLDRFVERHRLAEWWDLQVDADIRAVSFKCRPPFLSRAYLSTVDIRVPGF